MASSPSMKLSPGKCYALDLDKEAKKIGKAATARVQIVDDDGKKYEDPVNIHCELVTGGGEGEVGHEVEMEKMKSEYSLSYKPQYSGEHHLHIRVEGTHISRSPFRIMVKPADYTKELTAVLPECIPDFATVNLKISKYEFEAAGMVYGCNDNSYTYLLLESSRLGQLQDKNNMHQFRTFVEAVFYVGKGSGSRSHQHLKDAETGAQSGPAEHIVSLWKSKLKVAILQFNKKTNTIEAQTREACMIAAIGKDNLTNKSSGHLCWEFENNWEEEERKKFGVFNLHLAYCSYLAMEKKPLQWTKETVVDRHPSQLLTEDNI